MINEIDTHFAGLQRDNSQEEISEQDNTFSIYQLKSDDSTRDFCFKSLQA
jgi:hypothetical protein